jgi:hypothetical protein
MEEAIGGVAIPTIVAGNRPFGLYALQLKWAAVYGWINKEED